MSGLDGPEGGFRAYDGIRYRDWSMTRHLPGEAYPFNGSFRFGFEHGPDNRFPLVHSGAVFWYGIDGLDWRELSVTRTDLGGEPDRLGVLHRSE